MKIAGINKNSFVDMKGMISYVIFTAGCNFDCWYCHNRHILGEVEDLYNQDEIIEDINSRKKFIDIVVISGGEPTLQKDLIDFVKIINNMGILVKLDTNGTNPEIIEKLLKENLIHYIAMDYKAPIDKYDKIVERQIDKENLLRSVDLIMHSSIDYEFRTTFSPDLTKEDLTDIAKSIKGAKQYVIQQFVPHENMTRESISPHLPDYINETAKECRKYLPTLVKGIG